MGRTPLIVGDTNPNMPTSAWYLTGINFITISSKKVPPSNLCGHAEIYQNMSRHISSHYRTLCDVLGLGSCATKHYKSAVALTSPQRTVPMGIRGPYGPLRHASNMLRALRGDTLRSVKNYE